MSPLLRKRRRLRTHSCSIILVDALLEFLPVAETEIPATLERRFAVALGDEVEVVVVSEFWGRTVGVVM